MTNTLLLPSRIEQIFANNQLAKIAYLTACDGGDARSTEYFLALVRGGANILEVGVPFSDPIADGVVIQRAMKRALHHGANIAQVINVVSNIRRQSEVAIIIFTYYNPIQSNLFGFLQQIKQAGADGILVVDLPYEEAGELQFFCKQLNLALIMVASPSTDLVRIKQLSEFGSGFLYYACRKGTTGVRDSLANDIIKQIQEVQQHSLLPVAVGFGVANSDMVKQILSQAAGCVVGSYFVNAIAEGATPEKLYNLAKDMFAC